MEENNETREKVTSAILIPKDKKSETGNKDVEMIAGDKKKEGVLSTTDKHQSDSEDQREAIIASHVETDHGGVKTKPENEDQPKTTITLSGTDIDHDGEKLEGATSRDQPQTEDNDQLEAAIALSLTDTRQTDDGEKLEAERQEGETALSTRDKPQCHKVLVDQIKGVLYGNCIGDAIGLLTEFMDKSEAQKMYGGSRLMRIFSTKNLEYNQKVDDGHRCNWDTGDWTDDSDQMILILRTLVQNHGKFDEKDFAKKLKHWVRHGYEELGDTRGCGLGRTTASVLSHVRFLQDPHKAARDVWEGSGRFIAPNGGVMRTSVLGTMEFQDLDKVIENTKSACMVTHADPRCIASCVAVTIAIALMLQRKHVFNNGEHDVESIMNIAHWYAEREIEDAKHKEELKYHMFAESLDKLELASARAIGYTLKCMGAGFWAFRQEDFRKAIQAITMEAGDADTNCAVAGALLGCKVGFHNLPESWVTGLCHRDWLDNEIKSYLNLLGLQH